jgi:hypothetical protein
MLSTLLVPTGRKMTMLGIKKLRTRVAELDERLAQLDYLHYDSYQPQYAGGQDDHRVLFDKIARLDKALNNSTLTYANQYSKIERLIRTLIEMDIITEPEYLSEKIAFAEGDRIRQNEEDICRIGDKQSELMSDIALLKVDQNILRRTDRIIRKTLRSILAVLEEVFNIHFASKIDDVAEEGAFTKIGVEFSRPEGDTAVMLLMMKKPDGTLKVVDGVMIPREGE